VRCFTDGFPCTLYELLGNGKVPPYSMGMKRFGSLTNKLAGNARNKIAEARLKVNAQVARYVQAQRNKPTNRSHARLGFHAGAS
jgi:hypothetical protein